MNDIRLCPHCKKGLLEGVLGTKPYTMSHLQCYRCDSTYTFDQLVEADKETALHSKGLLVEFWAEELIVTLTEAAVKDLKE